MSEGSLRERCWRSPVAATLLQSLRIIKCSASHTASTPPAANRWQASFGERSPEGHAGLMLQLAETEADFRCAGGPEPPGAGTALGEMHRAAKEPGPSLYPHGVPASGMGCQPPPGLGTINGCAPPPKLQPRRATSLSSLVLNYLEISRIGMRSGWR